MAIVADTSQINYPVLIDQIEILPAVHACSHYRKDKYLHAASLTAGRYSRVSMVSMSKARGSSPASIRDE